MKKKFIVLFLSLTLLFNGCGNTATSKKSSELSGKYDFYQESVKNIQKNMNVDPDQADEIFLTLIDCGVSDLINYVIKNNDNTFSVWSSGKKYSVALSDGVVSTVFTNDFLKEVQLYPALETETTPNTSTDNVIDESEDTSTDNSAEIPARENSIGKSDKDIDALKKNMTVLDVHNDSTGNWRYITIAENTDFLEYVLSYYNTYFKNDKEIHAVINFTNKTTTKISVIGDMLDVTIQEYVDGEEQDANLLYSGSVYSEYFIYLDNGDIEEVQ